MKRFPSGFPWMSPALVALCASAALVPATVLEYDRARVAAGEVWRLLTGQMIHWTARMAAFDLGMLLGLGSWLELRGDRRLAAVALALGGGLTALAVHALFAGPLPRGVRVVPLVHLLGGLGGLATAACLVEWRSLSWRYEKRADEASR